MAKYVKTEQGYQEIETVNSNKMDANNPVGTGSFSMGRKSGSVIGRDSHAEGYDTTASGPDSHAEGVNTIASNESSHAEGLGTTASGYGSHAEGNGTTASGSDSHAEGLGTTASGSGSHAEGNATTASGSYSHAEGSETTASGDYSHAEGQGTKASVTCSHVQGKYNIIDNSSTYAHIVGNGTNSTYRSNAHTLDWNGVGWFKNSVKVGGVSQDDSAAKTLATTDYVDTTVSTKISGKQDTLIQSGAAVGQIAKITAVDSNGKPTAWEPVNMPSGGGTAEEYELIFTDTVTEDTGGYFRDTDANGNTFALKKVILIVFTPPYEESDTSYGRGVGFLPTTRWGHDCIDTLQDSIKSSAGGIGNYDVIFAEIIMGYQMCTARFESQNTTNVFSSMQPVTRAGATGLQFVGDATKLMQFSNPTGNMTCVKIVGYANPIVAKNTQIKLYGVRA